MHTELYIKKLNVLTIADLLKLNKNTLYSTTQFVIFSLYMNEVYLHLPSWNGKEHSKTKVINNISICNYRKSVYLHLPSWNGKKSFCI